MEPDSHCFLTLITKHQSQLALSGPSVFSKIPLWSIIICALKESISKRMANVFFSISSHIFCKTNLQSRDSSGNQTMTEALWVSDNFRWPVQNTGHMSEYKYRLEYCTGHHETPREVVIKRAAIRMKGNKPIHKKMRLKKYETKLKEKNTLAKSQTWTT